ncbi:DMT family transporter [Ancylobacter sp. 6x-1]|uniref:DMT family transporter n=1 Tax=Ancylobacter crimeensis TaxID=2579147 RepID=A0ABT0DCH2_9HYPH|nr:DMT family transporter [Ancylobacter crimeensis]MCK0197656.1 DMT family transporter [Ancylobacter crimeensis]
MRRPLILLALLATPLFFTSNIIVGRSVGGVIAPWQLAFWRWFFALAILLPIALPSLIRHRAVLTAQWKTIVLMGFIVMVLCGGNSYWGLEYTTATNATLIYASSNIMVVVLDAIVMRQRLPLLRILGAIAGFSGIVLITLQGEPGRLLHLSFNIGDLAFLAGAISWAFYALMLRDGPLVRIGPVPTFAATNIAGLILLAPFALAEHFFGTRPGPVGFEAWSAVAFLATIPSVAVFLMFQYCTREAGPTITAMFGYLMPVYGVVLAALLLGERLHGFHAAGFVLILGGVILATRPPRLPRPPASG